MKLLGRRQAAPALDPDDSTLLVYLYLLVREGIPACRDLTERRARGESPPDLAPEALAWAEAIAYAWRYARSLIHHPHEPLLDRLPDDVNPTLALGALARLAYAFAALVEEEPVEPALLSPEELDGLIGRYELKEWLDRMQDMIDTSVQARDVEPPSVTIDPALPPDPLPSGGMSQLREFLVSENLPNGDELSELPDRPNRETLLLMVRWLAMILLLADLGERYEELYRRREIHGASAEIDSSAIESAVDIATLMQWLRRERHMLLATQNTPLDPAQATTLLDDLCLSFILLTTRHQGHELAMLKPDWFDARLRGERLTQWVAAQGLEATLITDLVNELHELRASGADEDQLYEHALERLGDGLDRLTPGQ